MSLERRQAWPALAIMGIGILTLAITLKAAQDTMPVNPPWILGVLAALYLVLALVAEGFRWQAPLLFVAMVCAHAFTALLCGWGYSAVEGQPRALVAAFQHGLWDYLPGTALQFGFACLLGIVLGLSLDVAPDQAEAVEEDEPPAPPRALPDVATVGDLPAALTLAMGVPGVEGVLVVGSELLAAGVWASDPEAARQRVQAVVTRGGTGLNSTPLGDASLLTRAEDGRLAALLVTHQLDQASAHQLLRGVWGAAQQAWGEGV